MKGGPLSKMGHYLFMPTDLPRWPNCTGRSPTTRGVFCSRSGSRFQRGRLRATPRFLFTFARLGFHSVSKTSLCLFGCEVAGVERRGTVLQESHGSGEVSVCCYLLCVCDCVCVCVSPLSNSGPRRGPQGASANSTSSSPVSVTR